MFIRHKAHGNTKEIPENTKEIGPFFLSFRFKIFIWISDNFGAGGCVVEVLTEMLTPILTYVIFVIFHLSYVIYDINVKYVIFDRDI
jgi:hypothetical protein